MEPVSPLVRSVMQTIANAPSFCPPSSGTIGTAGTAPTPGTGGTDFGSMLTGSLDQVSSSINRSENLAARLAAGEDVDMSELAIAAEEASLGLSLVLQVRNRIVDGLNELLRTNVG